MILVMMVMLIFVVPQLTAMYDDFGAELPLMTKILIGVSSFLRKMWWFGAILLVGGLAGFQSYRKTSQGRRKIDELKINLPIFGPINVQVMMAELARTLALLVSAGTSILEALDIVSKSVDNVVFQTALLMAARGVEKGNPLAAMLAKQQMFPPLMAQMISVGEETGELDQVLVKVSRYFEAEAEAKIKNLTTAIEPVIMIVLGIGVAFLVMSIVMPLYQLVNQF
jgi:type IV pilus assembly protein PilC